MRRIIAELKIRVLHHIMGKVECLFFASFPIGKIGGNESFTFVSGAQLNDKNELLTDFIHHCFTNKPEIRKYVLYVVCEYLKKYEMEKKDFAKELYNEK